MIKEVIKANYEDHFKSVRLFYREPLGPNSAKFRTMVFFLNLGRGCQPGEEDDRLNQSSTRCAYVFLMVIISRACYGTFVVCWCCKAASAKKSVDEAETQLLESPDSQPRTIPSLSPKTVLDAESAVDVGGLHEGEGGEEESLTCDEGEEPVELHNEEEEEEEEDCEREREPSAPSVPERSKPICPNPGLEDTKEAEKNTKEEDLKSDNDEKRGTFKVRPLF